MIADDQPDHFQKIVAAIGGHGVPFMQVTASQATNQERQKHNVDVGSLRIYASLPSLQEVQKRQMQNPSGTSNCFLSVTV